MAIRKKSPKQITYKLLTAFELAKEIERVGYDVEIRFTTEDMMHKYSWEQPKQTHYIMRTRKYGGDNLIAGNLDGGGTMIRSTSDYISNWRENDPRARVNGFWEFACGYLLEFSSGAQRVAVQTVRTA